MGFLKNPQAFLYVLRTVIEITSYRFILFTAGFEALDAAVRMIAAETSSCSSQTQLSEDCISLFNCQLFCFTGYVSSNIRKLVGRRWLLLIESYQIQKIIAIYQFMHFIWYQTHNLQKAAHHLLMIFQATSSKVSYNGYTDRLDNNLSIFLLFLCCRV